MEAKRRYRSKPELLETLRRRERSARWLARKVGVSSALMGFVVSNQRTIAEDKARLVAALLGEDIDVLFSATDVHIIGTSQTMESAAA